MTFALKIVAYMLAIGGAAFIFRSLGRRFTGNKAYFRDMTAGVAIGYALAGFAIGWVLITYIGNFSGWWAKDPAANKLFFFYIAIHGLIIFAVAAYIFRALGRMIGTEGSKKAFRQMPVTAAFGIMIIIIYAFGSIFAGFIAPYGQEEVLRSANLAPGADPAHLLGTDQIGRDILSRLIYGGQNTVGIAFATTCLAFLIGITGGLP